MSWLWTKTACKSSTAFVISCLLCNIPDSTRTATNKPILLLEQPISVISITHEVWHRSANLRCSLKIIILALQKLYCCIQHTWATNSYANHNRWIQMKTKKLVQFKWARQRRASISSIFYFPPFLRTELSLFLISCAEELTIFHIGAKLSASCGSIIVL